MLDKIEYCLPLSSAVHKQVNHFAPPIETPDTHRASPAWYGAVLFYYFACAFSLVLTHGYWGNVLFFPLIYSYTLILVYIWKKLRRKGYYDDSKLHLNDLVRAYCHAFFGTSHLVLWIQLLCSLYINDRFDLDTESNDYEIYFIFFSIFLQGIIEEYIGKGIVFQHSIELYLPYEQYLNASYLQSFVWFGLCIGVGMSTMVDGVCAVCILGYLYGGWTNQLIIFVIRSLIGIPFHGLLGVLWGVNWCQHVISNQKKWQEQAKQKKLQQKGSNGHEDIEDEENTNDELGLDARNGGVPELTLLPKTGFWRSCGMWIKMGWVQAVLLSIYYIIQNQYLLLPSATINAETILVWLAVSLVLFAVLFAYVYWKFRRIQMRQQLVSVDDEDNDD